MKSSFVVLPCQPTPSQASCVYDIAACSCSRCRRDPDSRYPFPWETTAAFVLRMKAKGPPDDMVTLEVDRNV